MIVSVPDARDDHYVVVASHLGSRGEHRRASAAVANLQRWLESGRIITRAEDEIEPLLSGSSRPDRTIALFLYHGRARQQVLNSTTRCCTIT
jgi:hypothetical protein